MRGAKKGLAAIATGGDKVQIARAVVTLKVARHDRESRPEVDGVYLTDEPLLAPHVVVRGRLTGFQMEDHGQER